MSRQPEEEDFYGPCLLPLISGGSPRPCVSVKYDTWILLGCEEYKSELKLELQTLPKVFGFKK